MQMGLGYGSVLGQDSQSPHSVSGNFDGRLTDNNLAYP